MSNETFVKITYPKSPAERTLIESALKKNFVFEALSAKDMQEVIDCMKRRSVPPGHELIKQGDTGDFFYVIERGTYDIYVHGQKVVSFTRGQSFGELALLYNCPRAATCQSKEASEVWSLDRLTFRHLLQDAGKEAIDSAKKALSTVDLLRELTDAQLERIAEAVKVTQFQRGDVIVNYGDIGEMFYMIKSGSVTCLVPNCLASPPPNG